MKTLLFALLLGFSIASSAGWVEGTVVGVRDDNSKAPLGVFFSTYPSTGHATGVWHTIDVTSKGVPVEAKSIFLSGILIITHGINSQQCDLTVSLRAPGDTLNAGNYIGQTFEASIGNGMRSNMSSRVPLVNGQFEIQWNYSGNGQWPNYCSYGVNLSIQDYVR